ncbi:MAG: prephenate dehydratase [Planctomycetaceae bacterium]|jgi:prephenate dehydratase|nr:prephenate dehydratase [Planctomycetaceae bacterium]
MKKQIAIQGIRGSYHEIAAKRYFQDEEVEILACHTFQDVIAAVQERPDTLGLMAIENTLAGSLLQNHELIRKSGLKVVGEYKLRISHCLAALPGTAIQDVREINSHPMALLQCEAFLETLQDVKIVEKEDTATSAHRIRQGQLKHHAAICSKPAALMYGLEILAEEIETDKHNFTRFLMLAAPEKTPEVLQNVTCNKAVLVFSLPHSVGSLSQVLTILSYYRMNLTKIQSFPMVGQEWQYLFYVDFTFSDDTLYRQAMTAVTPLTKDITILGEFAEYVPEEEFPRPEKKNTT